MKNLMRYCKKCREFYFVNPETIFFHEKKCMDYWNKMSLQRRVRKDLKAWS